MGDSVGFSAVVASKNTSHNGIVYSDEILSEIARQARGVPVTVDFDETQVVGLVSDAEVSNSELRVSGTLNAEIVEAVREMFLVPGLLVNESDVIRPFAFGLTKHPVDKTITKVRLIGE